MHCGRSSPEKVRPVLPQKLGSDFCKYLHRSMPQGTQGLDASIFFLCVTRFYQCVVIVKEKSPLAPPNDDAATRSNGSVEGCVTLSHVLARMLQKRGFRVLSTLEEATPLLHIPSPVLHDGFGKLFVLRERSRLEL